MHQRTTRPNSVKPNQSSGPRRPKFCGKLFSGGLRPSTKFGRQFTVASFHYKFQQIGECSFARNVSFKCELPGPFQQLASHRFSLLLRRSQSGTRHRELLQFVHGVESSSSIRTRGLSAGANESSAPDFTCINESSASPTQPPPPRFETAERSSPTLRSPAKRA